MTRSEQGKVGDGDVVRYKGWDFVVVHTAFRLAKGMPVVLDLAWPERPTQIVYRSVLARFCTRPRVAA